VSPHLVLAFFAFLSSSEIYAETSPSPSPSPSAREYFDLKLKPVAPVDKTKYINSRILEFQNQKPLNPVELEKICGKEVILQSGAWSRPELNYVYDQGNLGVCYAIAASTLIDAYRINVLKTQTDLLTSPIQLAIHTNASSTKGARSFSDPKYSTYGGWPCLTINSLIQVHKTPLEQKKFYPVMSQTSRDQTCKSFEKLGKFYKECKKNNYTIPQTVDSCESRLAKAGYSGVFDEKMEITLQQYIETGAAADGFSAHLWENHFSDQLLTETEKQTLTEEYKKIPQCVSHVSRDAVQAIEKALDAELPMPVIAGIDASLIDPDHTGSHAVVIIGKRFNPNKLRCEYLVRNSWGKDFKTHPDWDKNTNGDFWVDRQELIKKTMRIDALETKRIGESSPPIQRKQPVKK
jgi:hypothetical protein